MARRRLIVAAAACGFVASIWLANWLVENVGPIRVWPFHGLAAPAGVYVVGLAFLLRDTCQRLGGQLLVLGLIAIGCALSAIVSPTLAGASAAAFAASEILGLAVFWALRGNTAGPAGLAVAVVAASFVAACLDSFVFLSIAFGRTAADPTRWGFPSFFWGQVIAKVSVVVIALPFVLAARRALPAPEPAAA